MADSWPLKTKIKQRRPPIGSNYYQWIGDVQQSLRDSERRRLELERKLFECSRSNRAISHLKYVKFTNALKEIYEWEKKALQRNQEILQDFDRIEAHARTLTTSSDKLQKMKSKYEKYMQRILPVCNKSAQTTQNQEEDAHKEMLEDGKWAGIRSGGSFHPATIFMSRQMSGNSSIEHFSTPHKTQTPTKSFSVDGANSCTQAAKNSTMTANSVMQTNNDVQCFSISDKIDGKTSMEISNKPATTSATSFEHEKTHSADIESVTGNRSNSSEDEESGRICSHLHERLSPESGKKYVKHYRPSSKVEDQLSHENPVINQDLCGESLLRVMGSANEQSFTKYGIREEKDFNMKGLWPMTGAQELDIESLDSSNDLTISISDSDDSATPTKPAITVQGLHGLTEFRGPAHSEQEESGCSFNCPQVLGSGLTSKLCLSEDGFFHLLQSVEEMLSQPGPKRCTLYQHTTLSAVKVEELICLSNRRMALKESDLQACTAVVFDQFLKLRQKTFNLPHLHVEEIDNPSSTIGTPKQYDSSLDSASCWERLYKHALFLKENNLLQKDNMTGILNALLATQNAEKIKTESLSMKVMQEESVEVCYMRDCEEVSSVHNCGSPCSLLSTESDTNEAKQAKLDNKVDIHKINKQVITASQVTNTSDQNKQCLANVKNELESISICDISSLDLQPVLKGPESDKISSEISGLSNPLSKSWSKKKVLTTMKSKAFWGESDDSTTDIEEVLQPQNTEPDDFDDFYD